MIGESPSLWFGGRRQASSHVQATSRCGWSRRSWRLRPASSLLGRSCPANQWVSEWPPPGGQGAWVIPWPTRFIVSLPPKQISSPETEVSSGALERSSRMSGCELRQSSVASLGCPFSVWFWILAFSPKLKAALDCGPFESFGLSRQRVRWLGPRCAAKSCLGLAGTLWACWGFWPKTRPYPRTTLQS